MSRGDGELRRGGGLQYLIRIGQEFINLEHVAEVRFGEDEGALAWAVVRFGRAETLMLTGDDAQALVQLMDSLALRVGMLGGA